MSNNHETRLYDACLDMTWQSCYRDLPKQWRSSFRKDMHGKSWPVKEHWLRTLWVESKLYQGD